MALAERGRGSLTSFADRCSIFVNLSPHQIVVHADNGGPMKGATILATMQKLGIVPSFSRPSVSNDNPFSESLFKTLKYYPIYPTKPFEDVEAAIIWMQNLETRIDGQVKHDYYPEIFRNIR